MGRDPTPRTAPPPWLEASWETYRLPLPGLGLEEGHAK